MQHSNTVNRMSDTGDSDQCRSGFNLLQIITGVLLVTASAYGYSLMHHLAVTIPAIMGASLIFYGAKTALICREGPLFRDNRHSTSGMTD